MTFDILITILYLVLLPTLVAAQAHSEGIRDSGNKFWAAILRDAMWVIFIVSFCMLPSSPYGQIWTTQGSLLAIIIYLLWRFAAYDLIYNKANDFITNPWYVGQTKWTDILLRKLFPVEDSRGWFLFVTRSLSFIAAIGLSIRMFY